MNIKHLPLPIFSLIFLNAVTFDKIHYVFSSDPIDVVIPCHPKDALALNGAIESVKKHVQGVRRIMVISSQRLTHEAEWIDETVFPFTKERIALEICKSKEFAAEQLSKPDSRLGWIYQQFLKLFSPFYIPNISSNVLIVDADVIFLKPVSFIQENGAGLYAVGAEYEYTYFDHAARVLPGLKKIYPNFSGITHHMLFQKPVLDDLFGLIEKHHNLEPWIAIARAISITRNNITFAGISEYEIYFNFVFSRTDQVKIRPLRWGNISETTYKNQSKLKEYDYVAIHNWNR